MVPNEADRAITRNFGGGRAFTASYKIEGRVPTVSGIVTVAQENRFQLALDEGGTRTFIVAHDSGIDPDQLAALQARQARVTVEFRPIDELIANEARSIKIPF